MKATFEGPIRPTDRRMSLTAVCISHQRGSTDGDKSHDIRKVDNPNHLAEGDPTFQIISIWQTQKTQLS